jgi:hypothetical protein
MDDNRKEKHDSTKATHDSNRDPLTNEPGAHSAGVGVGAAVGGAALGAAASTAAAGAALGSAAGPIGTAVGVVAGGIVGAVVGKRVAERINPTEEDAYWKEHYQSRPYVDRSAAYEDYRPAYRYGWESRARHEGKQFEDVESDLSAGWSGLQPRMGWDKAKPAVRDAWDRIGQPDNTTSS